MAEKKSKATPAATGNGKQTHTEDIDHEVISAPVLNPADAAANPHEQIKREIAKFNLADAGIAKLKEKYGALEIANADDKDGYKAVKEAWGEVRTIRTGLEKKGLELRNQYKVITSAISKEEDRLIDLVTPLEKSLYDKWKAIDDEKERAKREKEEAEQREAMRRVEEVLALGMEFKDGFYVIGESISMDVATLRALPDDKYATLKDRIKYAAEQIDKQRKLAAEQKQREREEFERQQAEVKRQQEEIAKQQRELQEQREQLERERQEAADFRLQLRVNKFKELGMRETEDDVVFKRRDEEVTVAKPEIEKANELQFAELLKRTKDIIANVNERWDTIEQNEKKALEEKSRKEKLIAETMQEAGMVYNYNDKQFQFKNKVANIAYDWHQLLPLTDVEISAKGRELSAWIQEAKANQEKKNEADRIEIEKLEKAAMGDAERYSGMILLLKTHADAIDAKAYKTKKYQDRVAKFWDRFNNLLTEFQ